MFGGLFSFHRARRIAFVLIGFGALFGGLEARAQALVATVNGDAITTADVEEREKILRVLGQAATPAVALESLIKSRVMADEVNKFGIHVSTSELAPTINYFAEQAHITPEALTQRLGAPGLNRKHLENFLSIQQAFNIYARARNRAVEVSEAELQAEIKRDPKLAHQQTYVLRQIVVTVPPSAGIPGLQEAGKKLEALRAKFTDCQTGAKIAQEMPDVIVREPVTRTSGALGEQFAAALDKMKVGSMTPASRDSLGIASIALCSRSASNMDSTRELAQQKIIARHINNDAEKLYQEIRVHAVVIKH